jgi:hypothetical protein
MPTSYSPPKLNPLQMAAVESGEYDFLVPTRKALMRTDEVASVLHRSSEFVRRLGEAGKLEGHIGTPDGRSTSVYTRRSVIMHLVETGNYDPAFMVMRVEAVLKTFKTPALDRIIAFANRQKNLIS